MLAYGERYTFLQSNEPDPRFGRDPLGLVRLFRAHQRAGVLRDDMPAAWLVKAFSALTIGLVLRSRNRDERPHESAHLLAETLLSGALRSPAT